MSLTWECHLKQCMLNNNNNNNKILVCWELLTQLLLQVFLDYVSLACWRHCILFIFDWFSSSVVKSSFVVESSFVVKSSFVIKSSFVVKSSSSLHLPCLSPWCTGYWMCVFQLFSCSVFCGFLNCFSYLFADVVSSDKDYCSKSVEYVDSSQLNCVYYYFNRLYEAGHGTRARRSNTEFAKFKQLLKIHLFMVAEMSAH